MELTLLDKINNDLLIAGVPRDKWLLKIDTLCLIDPTSDYEVRQKLSHALYTGLVAYVPESFQFRHLLIESCTISEWYNRFSQLLNPYILSYFDRANYLNIKRTDYG